MLCKLCSCIFSDLSYTLCPGLDSGKPNESIDNEVYIKRQQNLKDLSESTKNGCQLCYWLSKQESLGTPLEYQLRKYR